MDASKSKILKPIIIAVIILGSVLTLGLKFYMDHAALSVDRPSFIKTTPDKQLAILFGNNIYLSDQYGETYSRFDFDAIGLELKGDFDFFSNGDLLVYSNKEETSLLDNLKQFARMQETRTDKASNDNGFYRCHLKSQTCKIFNNALPAFHSSFRTLIDRNSDTIYIADTPKFSLYKVDADGILLAQQTEGFHFPNQMLLHNKALFLANTNSNSVKVLQTDSDKFGQETNNHTTVIDSENRWPSELIKTPNGWWVSIAGSNMDKARIQIFDEQWNKTQIVKPTTRKTDLWSMAIINDTVFVTDWSNINIYRFNLSGDQLTNFSNNSIDLAFEQARLDSSQFSFYSSMAFIGFIIVFGLGVLAAFILEKKESLAFFKGGPSTETNDVKSKSSSLLMPPGTETYWIETRYRKYRKIIGLLLLLPIPYVIYLIISFALNSEETPWRFMAFFIFLIPFLIFSAKSAYHNLSVRIGISGQLLLIDEDNGTIGIGKESAIFYTNTTIIIGKAVTSNNQANTLLFPKDEFNKWVKPRVIKGQKINEWALYKKLWALKHPSMNFIISLVIFMAATLAVEYI